ncbi:MAG: 1-deoxy-D-xylulose-5-phosphate reductoisomerase [Verrucomicrobia bacterium CG_4_10_14_3_um_filter_43_23]|nr:MAG: 1-deoxy-D-xylulose-5-phosphate reductoisomerase [Verrucomicrobia bacterium CG1_02_43_26]PIP59444.1 MAG: 1-deoxy-D-xylulose-5-phosphate reductoisomerase [Verrucomicrobia bacterium CG22_combo_CG10-13_8_21_14_all_43_17]PIX57891.1 MAG: 1-deoxy-D-xylulose-5-phosphate reductoisomerase [Verrucomicrobia bacterium CG_4_10_14_3_um_filter_43_23]PIY61094.1 MAG: 1-deoxy-D-xylulose-5-phosphate reductoisomerase [Verrucomicrobia bacterium CG_4_10_14_0_8_um_filter_43_34]PJA43796.1 MAG: 1-deoxy-D-xylulos
MKNVVLLGATGSVGENTLKVLRKHSDKLNLIAIAAYKQFDKLASIAQEFDVKHIALIDPDAFIGASESSLFSRDQMLYAGIEGLMEISTLPEADIVIFGLSGTAGLKPALAALEAGIDVAIANKEILVLGGSFLIQAAKNNNARILPVDSEHNAVFQCLEGVSDRSTISKVVLTASGGYFRDWPLEKLKDATPKCATKHPNWNMGPKITVDCATMANKGLELMEARWLFDLRPEQLDATLHPQSIIHALVQFVDGSVLSQMSPASMTFPIQYSLFYPDRFPGATEGIDLASFYSLQLSPIDSARYPCFFIAKNAMESGGAYPEAFNAANEIAVQAFLKTQIGFLDIPRVIEAVLENPIFSTSARSLKEALEIDQQARLLAKEEVCGLKEKASIMIK